MVSLRDRLRAKEQAEQAGVDTDLAKASRAAANILAGVEVEIQEIGKYVGLLERQYCNKTPNDLIAKMKQKGNTSEQINEHMKKVGKDMLETLTKMLARLRILLENDLRTERRLAHMFSRTKQGKINRQGIKNAAIIEDIYNKDKAILGEALSVLGQWDTVSKKGKPHWYGWGKLGGIPMGYPIESIKFHEMKVLVEADVVCRNLEKAGRTIGTKRNAYS